MRCKEAEKQIYLYRELSQKEQREVDQHVLECASCNQLLQSTHRVEALLKKSVQVNPQPKNPEILTQKILSSIKKKEQPSGFSALLGYLDSYFAKYAFATLSLILVAVFVNEYSQETVVLRQNQAVNNNSPTLNTSGFREKFHQRKRQKDPQPLSHYAYYKKLYSNKTL